MKKLFCALLAALMVAMCAGCGGSSDSGSSTSNAGSSSGSSSSGDEATYTLTFGCTGNEKEANYVGSLAWKDYIEAESNGRIKVELYPNGTMGNDREMAEAVQMGQLVSMATASSNMSNLVPELAIFDIPFILSNRDEVSKLFSDEEFVNTLDGYFEARSMKLLGQSLVGFRSLTSNREVHTMADLKGMSIRVMEAPVPMTLWSALGCSPTPISFMELYAALQQGLVEAQENAISMTYGQKFYEQQKYYIFTEHQFMEIFFIMNPDWYNALPEDLQAIIDSSMDVLYDTADKCAIELEETQLQEMQDYGMVVIELDDSVKKEMRDATQDVWDIVEKEYPEPVAAYRAALERTGLM